MRYKATPPPHRLSDRPVASARAARSGSMSPKHVISVTAAVLVSLVLFTTIPVAAGGAQISVSPSWTLQGNDVVVTGIGFSPNQSGQLALDGSAAGLPRFKASRQGGFTARFTVPMTAAFGWHTVQARTDTKNRALRTSDVAKAQFLIGFDTATATPPGTPGASPTWFPTPSPSPTPAPTPALSGASLSFPIQAAFYYPWFAEAWNQQGYNPFSWFTPTLGYYGTSAVAAQHVTSMQGAGIQAGIASWWGQGSATDGRIPTLLSVAGSFRWTLYYEQEGSSDPSIAQINSDLTYIGAHYASNTSYLRVAGKPVIFVYADGGDGCGMADRWKAANTAGFYVVLKVFPGYKLCANQPESWHQYAPAVAADHQAGYSYSISPGFWKRSESSARLVRDTARWSSNVAAMKASGEPWQLITTFNEWGEGTGVENTTQYGSTYLSMLAGSSTSAPPPSTSPTAAPTAAPTTVPPTTGPTSAPTAPPPPATPPPATQPPPTAPPPTATPPPPTAPPTAPPSGSAVLVGAGDIASCASSGDEAIADLIDGIAGTVFTAGDNVYDSGTPTEYTNCYAPSWGRFKARTKAAAGNHDWLTAGAAGYFGFFGYARSYYAYDLGAWRVYVIDSNCSQVGGCGVGSAQYNWLKADLAANPTACVAAYWHHPRFSSGEHGSSTSVQPIWQALYDAGAEVVLNGHDHDYERFAPQTPTGAADPTNGITEFVVGTGGKNHYAFGATLANSIARNADTFGVLKLTLSANAYAWKFIPEAGKSFTDSGSASCH